MRNEKTRWLSGIVVVVLSGGLLAGCGSGDDVAVAQSAPTDLSGVTQAWNKNLPAAQRFVTAFTGAVLDKNTGLVWEQAPETTFQIWDTAKRGCLIKNVGGTMGWRLPSVVELKSVQDPTLPAPFVPASVFTGVQSDVYWSATTNADAPTTFAWVVNFLNANVGVGNKSSSTFFFTWCVRGGMNTDQY